MSEWFVFRHDQPPLGPLSSDVLVRSVLAAEIPRDAWVGTRGSADWRRLSELPELAERLEKPPEPEKKVNDPLPRKYALLPLAIFGAFAALSFLLAIVGLIARPHARVAPAAQVAEVKSP